MPRKKEVSDVIVPEAQFVFDAGIAGEWLASSSSRLRKVFQSVRFEPDGINPDNVQFLLLMAAQSILGEYVYKRERFRGVLYVPEQLADSPVLESFERGGAHDGYVEFRLPLP